MAYRNKIYVCFDGDKDIHYYNLMKAWKQNDKTSFDFNNAHDLNNILSSSSEITIKRRLRERMNNSKILVVLIGESTKFLYKYVRWEIQIALEYKIPIIVVNINGKREKDCDRCPAILSKELAIHISFNRNILQYALEKWPSSHLKHIKNNERCVYRYPKGVYDRLGL